MFTIIGSPSERKYGTEVKTLHMCQDLNDLTGEVKEYVSKKELSKD